MIWTPETLKEVVQEKIGRHKFITVSNREPFIHVFGEDGIRCIRPASGMTVALNPVMAAAGGTWVAAGSGDADRDVVDERDRIGVPPEAPRYVLRRVWLTKEEEEAYYYGYSNEGLWPLCHIVHVRPEFRPRDWEVYQRVNQRFADVVCEELEGDQGFVFIQDYHFALLPKLIKERRPDVVVAHFWHIPWPNVETFRVCPQAEDLLWGLLGNDILGFHTRYHCLNFLDSADRFLEVRVDRERLSVFKEGRETLVRPFPISIDTVGIERIAESADVRNAGLKLKHDRRFRDKILAVGVERLDYTKGILERFRAVDLFLEKNPDFRGRFVYLQLGPLSRIHIPKYQEYNDAIYRTMVGINDRWRDKDWQPIVIYKTHLDVVEVVGYLRAADLCIVSSIHDGMNLVAKEFAAARTDEDGVLILSKFTGSARELESALIVHPYDTEEFAGAIRQALTMDREERGQRMQKMRLAVQENNVYRWAGKIVSEMRKLV
jgi:trehalose-6-phosphate synthase